MSRATLAVDRCASRSPLRELSLVAGRRLEEDGGLRRLFRGVVALHRSASADSAWIHPDDVEAGPNGRGVHALAAAPQELDGGRPWAAGVDEHRPDPVLSVRRREAYQRQLDRPTPRLVVVERHLGGGALEPAPAVAPVQHRTGG